MGILDRINERNTSAQGEAQQAEQGAAEAEQQAAATQAEEESGPDAVQEAGAGRQRHREAFQKMQGPDEGSITEEQAGPEEQAIHEKMERQMMEMVNSQEKGATEGLLKAVMAAEDPVQGIGMIASDIVENLKQAHPNASQEILLDIGERTIEQLVQIIELADPRIDLSEDDMGEALSIGIQQFNQTNTQDIDDDEMREFTANG
jgi:hypothetical protein